MVHSFILAPHGRARLALTDKRVAPLRVSCVSIVNGRRAARSCIFIEVVEGIDHSMWDGGRWVTSAMASISHTALQPLNESSISSMRLLFCLRRLLPPLLLLLLLLSGFVSRDEVFSPWVPPDFTASPFVAIRLVNM